ncbi:unnamed protein product [Polarella glacialis]|uniref:Uncharacterized protein n=1 Tax=Polarella glacialis TaxID=89957 RepID=A0A813GG20_POLGL|nr:unnamed protein product [Polarella glacialis]
MAVCASRLLCFGLRVPKLQRVIRCRQAAWSESRPGRALRLPCSVLVPPSLCSLPVISRDVPESAHLQNNSIPNGTPLISFGIIGSDRKARRLVQHGVHIACNRKVDPVSVAWHLEDASLASLLPTLVRDTNCTDVLQCSFAVVESLPTQA